MVSCGHVFILGAGAVVEGRWGEVGDEPGGWRRTRKGIYVTFAYCPAAAAVKTLAVIFSVFTFLVFYARNGDVML